MSVTFEGALEVILFLTDVVYAYLTSLWSHCSCLSFSLLLCQNWFYYRCWMKVDMYVVGGRPRRVSYFISLNKLLARRESSVGIM